MDRRNKRIFDKDFKIQTAKLIVNKEKKIAELARDLNINEITLHNWKNLYLKDQQDLIRCGHQI